MRYMLFMGFVIGITLNILAPCVDDVVLFIILLQVVRKLAPLLERVMKRIPGIRNRCNSDENFVSV